VDEDFGLIENGLAVTIKRVQGEGSIMSRRSARDQACLLVLAFPGVQIMARAGLKQERIHHSLDQLLSLLDRP